MVKENNYWYIWDTKKDMWAICSEHRGGYFIYTPDEQVADKLVKLFNLGEK